MGFKRNKMNINKIISIIQNHPWHTWIPLLKCQEYSYIGYRDDVLELYYKAEVSTYIRTVNLDCLLLSITYKNDTLIVEQLNIFALKSIFTSHSMFLKIVNKK